MHVLIGVTRKPRSREAPRRKGKGKDLEDRRWSKRRTCAGCICKPWCKPPCLQGESVCVLTDSALRPTGHSFEKTINVARAREGFENGGGATSRRSSLHSSLISPPRSLVGSSATEVNVSFMIISCRAHCHPMAGNIFWKPRGTKNPQPSDIQGSDLELQENIKF